MLVKSRGIGTVEDGPPICCSKVEMAENILIQETFSLLPNLYDHVSVNVYINIFIYNHIYIHPRNLTLDPQNDASLNGISFQYNSPFWGIYVRFFA